MSCLYYTYPAKSRAMYLHDLHSASLVFCMLCIHGITSFNKRTALNMWLIRIISTTNKFSLPISEFVTRYYHLFIQLSLRVCKIWERKIFIHNIVIFLKIESNLSLRVARIHYLMKKYRKIYLRNVSFKNI